MIITAEPTGEFEGVSGTRCRIWKGKTDKGVEVKLFVAMVQVNALDDNFAFEQELREVKASRDLVYFDHRMVGD